ncbi:putative UPF0481 protein At3g02645 [Rutidosis leptorrhynchoides]|uniref:putative UPF0481 protein At3g02645 n=1 Tax=Rutidosis leptorrhynchoides TaxID=125765 RepID=UPI003A98F682
MAEVIRTIEDPHEEWLYSILRPKSPPYSSTMQINKVPIILKEHQDHAKYYIPKVVSLGPYHYGNTNLEPVQNFKLLFTNKLLKGNTVSILSLFSNLAEMVHTLRGCYEGEANNIFSDDEFTRMMLLDGCFILYFINNIYFPTETVFLGMKSHQIRYVQQDMFLLENQIPYRVLIEVMKFEPAVHWDFKIRRFVDDRILAPELPREKRRHHKDFLSDEIPDNTNHLLELLQTRLTKFKTFVERKTDRSTFRNVTDLQEVGISFVPSRTRSLAHIKFTKYGFCGNLQLPPITVDDCTKAMLLNLIAYEMWFDNTQIPWVTSYICLLDSLIDHSEDVKILRKAGIIDNWLGSDDEVAQMFNEIGTGLVPNSLAFSGTKSEIQMHYKSKRNTWMSQLNREYIKTPWAFVALLVGLLGLFFSSVQTYFSVWGGQRL